MIYVRGLPVVDNFYNKNVQLSMTFQTMSLIENQLNMSKHTLGMDSTLFFALVDLVKFYST